MPGATFIADVGLLAQSALTIYRAVKGGTVAESCTIVTGATDVMLGVVQQTVVAADATIGKQVADVRIMGVTKWEASAAVSLWAKVALQADGRCATAGAAGTRQDGIALSAAGAAGDWIDVLLTPAGQVT
jgi:hypothetical protein